MKKFLVKWEEATPMGINSSHEYSEIIYAKTKRGAEGQFKREHHKHNGYDDIYGYYWFTVEEVEND